jgi:hypothetical protein
MCLKVVQQLARHDQESICQLHCVETSSLQVSQYFANEVHQVLNLTVATRLLSFNYNSCAGHIVHSRYIELQNFMCCRTSWGLGATRVGAEIKYRLSSLKASYASLVHWNLSSFFRCLKKGSPLTSSLDMNLLRAVMHLVSFGLHGGFQAASYS